MNITVVGSGYVGLVAAACFADTGNRVIGVDIDENKVRRLSQGEIPIYEPGLTEMVVENIRAHRLSFSTDLVSAVRSSKVIFIAVGTPPAPDGSADLSAISAVAKGIAQAMDGYRVIATKSTVPVGTHKKVMEIVKANTTHPFDYVSNPEFMKEGAALEDFTKPDRVVIGATSDKAADVMRELYSPYMRKSERLLVVDPASAEMIKYAANALLATKISFMNEVANLCEKYGADVELVRRGVGSDSRIGPAFLFPGVGYGGSCFPKDVTAFISMGSDVGFPVRIAAAVHEVNEQQRRLFAERVVRHFGSNAKQATVGVWGLAFKARTDDVRESPAIFGVKAFLEAGLKVRAYDPEAIETGRKELPSSVTFCDDPYDAIDGADALVIFTDWQHFRTPDFDMMAQKLKSPVIFDGRNLYDPRTMAQRGFAYHCVGRPSASPS